ncbi:MAG: RNA methyltransferase, partial [Phycisphaerae bacterium]|nr:RNA methyltransferase [Phycisphaerae bacterium]
MPIVPIESLDDPRVAAYCNLKDRELAARHGRFIAEGEFIVRRLIRSTFPVESVLCTRRRADEISAIVPPELPLYVADHQLINRL